jgi:hypothetical protein
MFYISSLRPFWLTSITIPTCLYVMFDDSLTWHAWTCNSTMHIHVWQLIVLANRIISSNVTNRIITLTWCEGQYCEWCKLLHDAKVSIAYTTKSVFSFNMQIACRSICKKFFRMSIKKPKNKLMVHNMSKQLHPCVTNTRRCNMRTLWGEVVRNEMIQIQVQHHNPPIHTHGSCYVWGNFGRSDS